MLLSCCISNHGDCCGVYSTCLYNMYICWKLLSNQNVEGPYLGAGGRGGHGVAKVSRPTTSHKVVT